MKRLEKDKGDILKGKTSFIPIYFKKDGKIIGSPNIPLEPSFDILYLYNKLPSKSSKGSIITGFYKIHQTFRFEDTEFNGRSLLAATAKQASMFVNKINNYFRDINAKFKDFSVTTNNYGDNDLIEIAKSIKEIVAKMDVYLKSNYWLFYGENYIPTIVQSRIVKRVVSLTDLTPLDNVSKGMYDLYNEYYKSFYDNYAQLFNNLSKSRNI